MNRHCGWMFALLAALVALAFRATAGELVLFEYGDMSGRQIRLRGPTPNFDQVNFNDRAESMRVLSGVWEVCTDGYFRGRCATFGPGDYGRLDDYLVRRLSSAREIDSGFSRPPAFPTDGSIVFFEREGFQGRRMGADAPLSDFDRIGFNDRTSSLIVRRGNWEVCTDAEFRGRCRVFPPGQYPSLGLELTDRISSVRPSRYDNDPGGGRPRPPGDWFGTASGELILFEHDNFRGQSRTLHDAAGDFERLRFNRVTSSLLVRRGQWLLCTEPEFRGNCRTYGPGEYRSLGQKVNDQFSSARPLSQ